ncbi:MAG TPA: cyclopropane-fatty-acyl-phospholipid synthase family protein [Vicinamibacterales bacterium]|nr:cyclopropane-fatty-acyl-phospholipid synthase family protein [Vicinamibacterales bacterium]
MPISWNPAAAGFRQTTAGRGHQLDHWLAGRLQQTIAPAAVGVELWDGWCAGDTDAGALLIHDRGALLRLIVNPDFEFGELYTSGRIAIRGDFVNVLERLSRLSVDTPISLRERAALWTALPNGLFDARRNIHHHYDIGNDFYQLWLDANLVYTCAYYPERASTLDEAQAAKLDLVCRKLALRPDERVADVGCGWGALALHMARHYGVRVQAFNISREQIAYARTRAAREGLAGRVEFIEDDYRNVSGRFDVFASVGMLEHVGRRSFGDLAAVVRRTLDRHTGRGLLHFIGRHRPRPLNAWIRRRIFPGAYVPTLAEVFAQILEPARQNVVDVENLRLHYARTLQHWRERFERAEPAVRARFDEPFARAWRLYLAGSECAFTTGWLQLFQVVFAPADRRLHWTRAEVYSSGDRR